MNKQDEKKKSKKILMPIYLLAAILIVSLGFSWWGGVINKPAPQNTNAELSIGKGDSVVTEIQLEQIANATGKKLVPAGRAAQSAGGTAQNTEEYSFEVPVKWIDTNNAVVGSTAQGTIQASAQVAVSGGNKDLINVNVTDGQTIDLSGAAVNIPVKVTLTEPSTQDEYNNIVNAKVTITLTVNINVNP